MFAPFHIQHHGNTHSSRILDIGMACAASGRHASAQAGRGSRPGSGSRASHSHHLPTPRAVLKGKRGSCNNLRKSKTFEHFHKIDIHVVRIPFTFASTYSKLVEKHTRIKASVRVRRGNICLISSQTYNVLKSQLTLNR